MYLRSQLYNSVQSLQNSTVHRKASSTVNGSPFLCSIFGIFFIRNTASIQIALHSNPKQTSVKKSMWQTDESSLTITNLGSMDAHNAS